MEYLTDPIVMRAVLNRFHFKFRKKYGQNFLMNADVLHKMADAAGLTGDDFVLEIGPGFGTLTQVLSERAGSVLSVEVDRDLMEILDHTLFGLKNVTVINEDIMNTDIEAVAVDKNGGRPIKVCANLPYYITTPVIMKLLKSHAPIESITVMVQNEVAKRMTASPGCKDYGALTLACEYYAEPELICEVPAADFYPSPKVDSAVVNLAVRDKPLFDIDEEKLFSVIRSVFSGRRKTIVNSLLNCPEIRSERTLIESAVEDAGFDKMIRGEKLCLKDFVKLTELLENRKAFQ